MARRHDVYQLLLPLFQISASDSVKEVEKADASNSDDGRLLKPSIASTRQFCLEKNSIFDGSDSDTDQTVPKRPSTKRCASPLSDSKKSVKLKKLSPSPEPVKIENSQVGRPTKHRRMSDGRKSEDDNLSFSVLKQIPGVQRLRRLLSLQEELVNTDVLDKDHTEALDKVVKEVTKKCLDDEKTLAAVAGFLRSADID